jgi:hypothetical protein
MSITNTAPEGRRSVHMQLEIREPSSYCAIDPACREGFFYVGKALTQSDDHGVVVLCEMEFQLNIQKALIY